MDLPSLWAKRLAHQELSPSDRNSIQAAIDKPGKVIATWDFSIQDAQHTSDGSIEMIGSESPLRVEGGMLQLPTDIQLPSERSLGLHLAASVPSPVTLEIVSTRRQNTLPLLLHWSEEGDSFKRQRRVSSSTRSMTSTMATTSFDVAPGEPSIKNLMVTFRANDTPIGISSITLRSPSLRSASIDQDSRLSVTIDHTTMNSLWAVAPSSILRQVWIPEGARLTFSTAIAPESATRDPRPVTFRVIAGKNGKVLFSQSIDPTQESHSRWHDAQVDLSDYEGESLELYFETISPPPSQAHEESVSAVAYFGAPTVVSIPRMERLPRVVLNILDTTRADRLSAYGFERDTSPFLRKLSEDSVVFEDAFSQSSWTSPSTASLLTSQEPWQLGIAWNKSGKIPADVATLAEVMRDAGFATAAFIGNFVLRDENGYRRGFDTFHRHPSSLLDAEELTNRALRWVENHRDEPFFLYMHYVDPHAPYDVPEEYVEELHGSEVAENIRWDQKQRPATNADEAYRDDVLYQGEIRFLDNHLGRLHEHLNDLAPLFVVGADHGEAFLEHGFVSHGANLHTEVTRVPLIFSWPRVLPPARIRGVVRNLDIMPSILDFVGIQTELPFEGVTLREFIKGNPQELVALSETNSHGPRRLSARDNTHSFMTFNATDSFYPRVRSSNPHIEWRLREFLQRKELYLRSEDPLELQDRYSADTHSAHDLQRKIDEIESKRHEGFVIRFRGSLVNPFTAKVPEVSGSTGISEGSSPSYRSLYAEFGVDQFDAQIENGDTSRFHVSLPGLDEDWLFIRSQDPDATLTLELNTEAGMTPALFIAKERRRSPPQRIVITRQEAETTWDELLPVLDRLPEKPVIQVWWLADSKAAIDVDMTEEERRDLERLGYVHGDGEK